MRKTINLPETERKTFKKHFLASVHSAIRFGRIDLSSILSKKDELASGFKQLGFTDSKDVVKGEFTVQHEDQKPALVSQQTSSAGYLYTNPTLKSEIRLEQDRVVYSEFNYSSFEEFNKSFQSYIETIFEILSVDNDYELVANKVGLRKINSVLIQPVNSIQNALGIFNASLFSVPRSGLLNFESFKVHEEATILDKTEEELSVLKAKLTKPQIDALEATIDFDFVRTTQSISLDKVFSETLPVLNQEHFDAFMWSITDELITVMETE